MRISWNHKIRLYAGLLIFIFVIGGAILLVFNLLINNSLEQLPVLYPEFAQTRAFQNSLAELNGMNTRLAIGLIIFISAGLLTSLLILIRSFRLRLRHYHRLIEKLRIKKAGTFTLEKISFPEEDEFGNLGAHLNTLISILREFDSKKSRLIRTELDKTRILGEELPLPCLVLDQQKIIIYVNRAFLEKFQHKETIENYRLEAVFQSPELQDSINAALSGEEYPREQQAYTLRADKEEYRCSIVISPLPEGGEDKHEILLLFPEIKHSFVQQNSETN